MAGGSRSDGSLMWILSYKNAHDSRAIDSVYAVTRRLHEIDCQLSGKTARSVRLDVRPKHDRVEM